MLRVSLAFWLVAAPMCWAQGNVLSVAPVGKVQAKRNETVPVTLKAQLREGYHVNSSKPNDEYLIPIRLTWEAAPLQLEEVVYPKPETIKSAFSEKPLSVYSGTFDLVSKLKVPANATAGPVLATGKLRYQACNDRMCLPPKIVEIPLTIYVQ